MEQTIVAAREEKQAELTRAMEAARAESATLINEIAQADARRNEK